MTDEEKLRMAMIESGVPQAKLTEAVMAGRRLWNTEAFREDFEAIGFMAPLVRVRRKKDGIMGAMMFTHSPRYYFNGLSDDGTEEW